MCSSSNTSRKYDRRPMLAWAGVVTAILAIVVGGIGALSGADGDDDPDLAAASSDPADVAPTSSSTTSAPSAPAEVTSTTTPATTTTLPMTTTTLAPTTVPTSVPVASFRKPFLVDAHVASCSTVGAEDVYVVGFSLSGARDIVLGGQAFLGGSGDGAHEIRHSAPAGSTGWLDRITVADGLGDDHAVPITPPLYLGGCSA